MDSRNPLEAREAALSVTESNWMSLPGLVQTVPDRSSNYMATAES